MNPHLARLQAYPFEKLNALKSSARQPDEKTKHISLSIGEPKHAPPEFVLESLRNNLDTISAYPSTKGSAELREAIAAWLEKRFALSAINPDQQILPVNGTREALFAFAQACIDPSNKPLVVSPNPFYQIYEGAAYLAGADLHFLNCTAENNYLPDFDSVEPSIWQQCQLIYICSPGNPSGAVMQSEQLQRLIELADQYDFIIASDECYSEIYRDETKPPVGLLEVCSKLGRDNYERCVVFHSLSKRSNLPGLRSGFAAGDAAILEKFLQYRTYHGCAMSMPTQIASTLAWQDEIHVQKNRELYREKFTSFVGALAPHLPATIPEASFYVWLKTPTDDLSFTKGLYSEENITVLPGRFIAREFSGLNPGEDHVRIALVANHDECMEAANRILRFINK
ncbi:succinyldiaminopimelate transaminase [Aurantivibrio infirmus]